MARSSARRAGDAPASGTHSGKLLLRMPPALHARLAQEAEKGGVSLNQLITTRLEASLQEPRAGTAREVGRASAPAPTPPLTTALRINLAVVVLAGVVAVVLLVLALVDLL